MNFFKVIHCTKSLRVTEFVNLLFFFKFSLYRVLFLLGYFVALFWDALCFICFAAITLLYVNCRWHAVASWTWDAQDETCGICRMAFDGCCPDCKLPGDDCPLSKYTCYNINLIHLHLVCSFCHIVQIFFLSIGLFKSRST